jgi:hypothetical protein
MGQVHNAVCELIVKLMELYGDHTFYSLLNVDMVIKYSTMRQVDA